MTPEALQDLLNGYLAAWSEPDPQARHALLERVWDANGDYTDPMIHAPGIDALDAAIAGLHANSPGATFALTSPIDHHHDHIRFFWVVRDPNGNEIPGMDYGQLSPDGKLLRIVGFF